MKSKIVVLTLILLQSCSNQEKPSTFYERYNQNAVAGFSSIDEYSNYFSAKKKGTLEAQIADVMNQSKMPREKAMQMALGFTQAVAKCKEISLVEERIESDRAYLKYSQKDICDNSITTNQYQLIQLIDENGWRIDDINIDI